MDIKVGQLRLEPATAKIRVYHTNHWIIKAVDSGSEKRALKIAKYKGIKKMIKFKFLGFSFVVYVPHTVNKLVTAIILNITSQEHLMFTLLHIGSRLFKLFSKEVCVKKQPGMPLTHCLQKSSVFPCYCFFARFLSLS